MIKYWNILDEILDRGRKEAKKFRPLQKTFWSLVIVYTIGISAILRADFNYVDDMGRVIHGYQGWENFSRFLSNYFSNIIHADSYLTDVSPLPQILAVMLMALSGSIVLYVVSGGMEFSLYKVIALVPLGLSPYFLECISYKYDSPYMALSVLLSIVPLLFGKFGYRMYIISTIIGMIGVCTTYQSSTGIYPMLVLFICIKFWNEKKSYRKIGKFLISSVIGYISGLIIFKLFVMRPVTDDYVSGYLPELKELIPIAYNNLREYLYLVKTDLKMEWLFLILGMCVAFIFIVIRDSKQSKIAAFWVASIGIVGMLFLSFGVYPFLVKPVFMPRAMYGFGVFITLLGVFIASANKAYSAKIVSVILSWAFFVFAFTYGNALAAQHAYTDLRVAMVLEDLKDLDYMLTDEAKVVQIEGSIGYAPVIQNMPQDYQILNRLVPVMFQGPWMWGEYEFFYYYGLKNIIWDQAIDIRTYNLPIIKDTIYHTIRGNEKNILIELKQ